MTVVVFTFVLVLANVLKEILMLLINGQASVIGVAEAFGLLFPWVLVFTLPMGMLTAALLVFGRLSADNEITAVRSSGVSLVALISPVLILSVLLCALSAWINLDLSPRCRVAYKHLTYRMIVNLAAGLVPEGRYVTISNSLSLYVERIVDGHELRNIHITQGSNDMTRETILKAPRGMLSVSNQQIMVTLYDVQAMVLRDTNWTTIETPVWPITIGSKSTANAESKPDLSDMTFRQLQAELREQEKNPARPIGNLTPEEQIKFKAVLAGLVVDPTLAIRVQMHRQVAFSFACLGFTLVGIPLGIRAHRRETNAGFMIAILLAVLYYAFEIVGVSLRNHPEFAPHLLVWAPNFIFQAVGVVMLWRANRGI